MLLKDNGAEALAWDYVAPSMRRALRRDALGLRHVGVRASSSGAPVHAGYRLAVRGGPVPDRHVEHCRWAEQRAMAHQDGRWGGLAMQYGGYGGLFMG